MLWGYREGAPEVETAVLSQLTGAEAETFSTLGGECAPGRERGRGAARVGGWPEGKAEGDPGGMEERSGGAAEPRSDGTEAAGAA